MKKLSVVLIGMTSLSMDVKLMSCNMRGSNTTKKLHSSKRLLRKFRPSIMGLQDTKRSMVNITMARSFWGNQPHKWGFLHFSGMSRGLLLFWNADIVRVHDILKGDSLCPFFFRLLAWTHNELVAMPIALMDHVRMLSSRKNSTMLVLSSVCP